MPFVVKIAASLNHYPGEVLHFCERAFYDGGNIESGDEAFVWFSGTSQRLAWLTEVEEANARSDGRIAGTLRLIGAARRDTLTKADLVQFRNVSDGSVMSELSEKLYRQSHNKVASISAEASSLLRSHFHICK